MSVTVVIAILVVAFLAGMDGILDEWEFQQPLVACTLIGWLLGDVTTGVLFGGSLQMITIGWMNIGAAVAPDTALAAVGAAVWVCGPAHLTVAEGLAIAIPLALIGQGLTVIVRRLVVKLVHYAERSVRQGNLNVITRVHLLSLVLQGLRVVLPTALILLVPTTLMHSFKTGLPHNVVMGLAVAGGLLAVVGYAIVVNMMATKWLWPFFILGVVLAAITALNMIAIGLIGLALAIIYVQLQSQTRPPSGPDDEMDALDRELEDL